MPTPDISLPDVYKIRVLEAPTNYTITTDAGLEDIHIKEIPEIQLKSDSTVDAGLKDIHIKEVRIQEFPKIELESNSTLSSNSAVNLNSDNNIRIKEIPEIRAHVPMNFNFGIKFWGVEFLVFSLCGELQLITEKYVPNRWERCEDPCENPTDNV